MIYKCIGCGQEKDKTEGVAVSELPSGVACPSCVRAVFPEDSPVIAQADRQNGFGPGRLDAQKVRDHFVKKPSPLVGAPTYSMGERTLPSIESLAFALFRTDPRVIKDAAAAMEMPEYWLDINIQTFGQYMQNGKNVDGDVIRARVAQSIDKAWSSDRLGLATESRKRAQEMIAVMGAKK